MHTRIQKGHLFHRGDWWYVRFFDDVLVDGVAQRKQVSKQLEARYSEYRSGSRKLLQPFVDRILQPVNQGKLDVRSTQTVVSFGDDVYLPEYVTKQLRPASQKQYKDVWKNHLKPRMGSLTLRDFRTMHAHNMLQEIAQKGSLGRSSLRHCKAFLSGLFKFAKNLGILDGTNPIQDVKIPRVAEPEEDTHAYSLVEVRAHLARVPEPARTVIYAAAFAGLTKSELRGLLCDSYKEDVHQLSVTRSVWNGTVSAPKTKARRAAVPVIKPLADALRKHLLRMGKLAGQASRCFRAALANP